MYYTNSKIKISTPKLIEILENSFFKIISTDTEVIITDTFTKKNHSIFYIEVEELVKKRNAKLYKYYCSLCEEESHKDLFLSNSSFNKSLLQNRIQSAKDTLNLFRYYVAIQHLASNIPRIQSIVGCYLRDKEADLTALVNKDKFT